jgi:CheY-like chemotaxis protein
MNTSISILMADDDADDRFLTQSAFEEIQITNPLHFVEDGVELMEYLTFSGKYSQQLHPLPGLILLDLNMPRMGGKDALREIKANPHLRRIPVVILSTSKSEKDIVESYDLGANCFITKPASFDGLLDVVRQLGKFWLDVATVPHSRIIPEGEN